MGETKEWEREVLDLLRQISANTGAIDADIKVIGGLLAQMNTTLGQILTALTTPPADTDITSLGGSISTPVKRP